MSTLLRDVIDIPDRVGAEDYVLRLTDSVGEGRVAATLRDYVVTPALAQAFDRALDLVVSAIGDGTSRGAFLAGSFGSGKSHFMAVLHALLRQDPAARAVPELQDTVARHDPALGKRRVLPLAYHLLGATSLEQAVLGGYVAQIHALHPQAQLPAVHESDGIFRDAERLRASMGDEAFFAALNGSGASEDAWSRLLGSGGWDGERYQAARAAGPGTTTRQELVSALVEHFFSAYTTKAAFLDLDTGLARVAAHAKGLGYDAVVLFLDELVLWLAFSVQDRTFFGREAQKLTKLVESASGPRAIPLISIVARQIDLRQWFASSGAQGSEQQALEHAFRHQEGRFATIVLGDDNLPQVAHQRLLRPHDAAGALVLTEAFARLERRPELWDVLLDGVNTGEQHRGADEAAFRLTYPFSPALVSLLRSLASVMQRERTALKVMQQMLVERRDTLTVDDVVPVGDAFDHVVSGQDALDPAAASRFRAASTLYRDKLRPLLLQRAGLTDGQLRENPGAATPGFRADERLAKTLLLSGVAPEVPALKGMTASRLASLNHGSIVSPLPGREASDVLARVQQWSGQVPEIHVGEDPRNPVIRVRLSEVDYESVVDRAKGEDNDGRRCELIIDLVKEALGVGGRERDVFGAIAQPVIWRGSRRDVDIVFGNVRDAGWLTEDHFRARPGTWRLVVDYPFDEAGHSAADDLARLDRLIAGGLQSRTLAWLPRFLSEERVRDLRRLVILQYLLTGDRWVAHADHLSEIDRAGARAILDTQRGALRESMRRAIQEAYGAAAPTPGTVIDDPGHDRVLVSLDRGFDPVRPVGADLGAAYRELVDRAFASSYPDHPRFEPPDAEVRTAELTTTYTCVERAVADRDGRVLIETGDRAAVRRVSDALQLGYVAETHFLFGDDRFSRWGNELERAQGRAGLAPHDPIRVEQARGWITAIRPELGLLDPVCDLVLLAWAALRQRAWYLQGAPIAVPRPGQLRGEMEMRPEPLPMPADWERAVTRAGQILGVTASTYMTGAGVATLAERVRTAAGEHTAGAATLAAELRDGYHRLGIDPSGGRLATAEGAATLLTALTGAHDRVALVEVLARADLPATPAATARSISSAAVVATALREMRWEQLEPLQAAEASTDGRAADARAVLQSLRAGLAGDEIAIQLAPALDRAERDAFRWVAQGIAKPQPQLPPHTPPDPPGPVGARRGSLRHAPGDDPEAVLARLREVLEAHPDAVVAVDWRVGDTPG